MWLTVSHMFVLSNPVMQNLAVCAWQECKNIHCSLPVHPSLFSLINIHRDEGALLRPRYAVMNHVYAEGGKGEETEDTPCPLPKEHFGAQIKWDLHSRSPSYDGWSLGSLTVWIRICPSCGKPRTRGLPTRRWRRLRRGRGRTWNWSQPKNYWHS